MISKKTDVVLIGYVIVSIADIVLSVFYREIIALRFNIFLVLFTTFFAWVQYKATILHGSEEAAQVCCVAITAYFYLILLLFLTNILLLENRLRWQSERIEDLINFWSVLLTVIVAIKPVWMLIQKYVPYFFPRRK